MGRTSGHVGGIDWRHVPKRRVGTTTSARRRTVYRTPRSTQPTATVCQGTDTNPAEGRLRLDRGIYHGTPRRDIQRRWGRKRAPGMGVEDWAVVGRRGGGLKTVGAAAVTT